MTPLEPVTVFVVPGIGEVTSDTDLGELLIATVVASLQPGDIVVITSKIVSKAEGRSVRADDREDAITEETVRVVATRRHPHGTTRIVENRLGIVAAAAGVDTSNVADGTVLLLPQDPDHTALTLARLLHVETGFDVGVVISDTLGRAWREGQTDVAIGAAGLTVVQDYRGMPDMQGRMMQATVVAVADEIAAAADLVMGKTSGYPVAIVRGLSHLVVPASDDTIQQARSLVRPANKDMFRLGTAEAFEAGRRAAAAHDSGAP